MFAQLVMYSLVVVAGARWWSWLVLAGGRGCYSLVVVAATRWWSLLVLAGSGWYSLVVAGACWCGGWWSLVLVGGGWWWLVRPWGPNNQDYSERALGVLRWALLSEIMHVRHAYAPCRARPFGIY